MLSNKLISPFTHTNMTVSGKRLHSMNISSFLKYETKNCSGHLARNFPVAWPITASEILPDRQWRARRQHSKEPGPRLCPLESVCLGLSASTPTHQLCDLGKELNHSDLQFPHLQNQGIHTNFVGQGLGLPNITHAKHSIQCQTYESHSKKLAIISFLLPPPNCNC